jgi:hypothetical protein
MDKDVLKQQLMMSAAEAADQAITAVERARDGRWIADSEWRIRDIYLGLMNASFQKILQSRIDAHPAAGLAAFSPSRQPGDFAR